MTRIAPIAIAVAALLLAANSVEARSASIRDQPDLVVRGVSAAPHSVALGGRTTIRIRVGNVGRRASGAARVGVYLSSDSRFGLEDALVSRGRRIGRLGAHATSALRVRLRVVNPPWFGRPLRLIVCADTRQVVAERKEENNCRAARNRTRVRPPGSIAHIESDLSAGRLSKERALVYSVWAVVGDRRLPERYHGDPGVLSGTSTMQTARERFESLSRRARRQIHPYFSPPDYSKDRGRPRARASQLSPCHFNYKAAEYVDAPDPARARFWFPKTFSEEDRTDIRALADELGRKIWPRLTEILGRTPIEDASLDCPGPDGRLDIYLFPKLRSYVTGAPPCTPGATFMMFDPDAGAGTLAHEFTHVLQLLWPRDRRWCNSSWGAAQDRYLSEAVAMYAPELVYPGWTGKHHENAAKLVEVPTQNWGDGGETMGYSGWSFLYSALRNRDAGAVLRGTYAALRHSPPLKALDDHLPDGFDTAWPAFARAALNQPLTPALTESFFSWDDWHAKPAVPKTGLSLQGRRRVRVPLPINVAWRGKAYYDLQIQGRPRYVAFHRPAGERADPRLRTRAFWRDHTGWQEADWSPEDLVTFCRSSSQQVRRVILVHTLSAPVPDTRSTHVWAVQDSTPSITLGRRCPGPARRKPPKLPCQPTGCAIELLGISGRESWSANTISGPDWRQCTTTASATHTHGGGTANAAGLLEIRDEGVEVNLKRRHYYLPELELRASLDRIGSGEETRRCHDTLLDVTETTVCSGQGSSTGEVEVIGVAPDDAYELDRLARTIEVDLTYLISPLFVPGIVTGYERTPPDPNPDSPVGQRCSVDAAGQLMGSSEGQSSTRATRISMETLLSGAPVTATITTMQTIGDSTASWSLSVTFRLAGKTLEPPS